MNVNLKSKELISLFQNNGILTPSIAQKRANNIEINLTGPVSNELIEDIKQIAYEFPNLLRHITVKNNTDKPIDMQKLVDAIGEEKRFNSRFKKFISFKVESTHREDFNLDYGNLTHVDGIALTNTDPNAIASLNLATYRLPQGTKDLTLDGFDLSTIDLNLAKIKSLTLSGSRNVGFSRMMGKDGLTSLYAMRRQLDSEVRDIIDFANNSRNLHTFGLSDVNLQGMKILEVLRNPGLAAIVLNRVGLNSLDGLEFWNGKLDRLSVINNQLGISDLERLNEFRRVNNETYVSLGGNSGIVTHFRSLSTEDFSPQTTRSIADSFTNEVKDMPNRTNTLTYLAGNKYTPYSIYDAERVRGQAKITLNPMFIERMSDLESFDFNQPHLAGGTLLLTVEQVERMIALNKQIPMNISIGIKNASELSSEKLQEIYQKVKITDIRMIGSDISDNQRDPYTPIEYVRARELLDEVVSGIDPKESDIDKFTTIYTRLAKTMTYDYSAIKSDTAAQMRHSSKVSNTSRNLIGGLSSGQCVCAGYAETLRNALALVGIRARYIRGKCYDDPDYTSRHAWTHVELANSKGEKKWYLADLTWDSQEATRAGDRANYRYMLIGEPDFRKDHQVTYTKYMHQSSVEAFDRDELRRAMDKANGRFLNPRVSLKKRMEEREKARKLEEQKRKEAEEKKRQEELKKKSEEERKKEEEKRKALLEKVSYEGLADLKGKRDKIKTELDSIYALLRQVKDLPHEKQVDYRNRAQKIEEEVIKMNSDIETYKDQLYTKEMKAQNEDKARLEELMKQKEEQEKAATKKETKKQELPKPRPVVEVNKDFLDAAKNARIAMLESMIANREAVLIGYGDKAHQNREIELAEWKKELSDLKTGKIYDSLVETAKKNEIEDLKQRIANREAMIAGRGDSLNPIRFTELEEWKKRLGLLEGNEPVQGETVKEEPKPEAPVIDPMLLQEIAGLEKRIKEREARMATLTEREVTVFERFELKSEEEIQKAAKKSEKENQKEIKEREKETKIYAQTNMTSALKLKTKADLIANERKIRVEHAEASILRFSNRLFNRSDDSLPDWMLSVVDFGVGATMTVRNAFDRWIHGEDKYDAELEAVKNSQVVVTKEGPRMEGRSNQYRVEPAEIAANKPKVKNRRVRPTNNDKDLEDR